MPALAHLQEADINALYAYLSLLAGAPDAPPQSRLTTSWARLGEHIIKGTCHICHDAVGPRPSRQALVQGTIPRSPRCSRTSPSSISSRRSEAARLSRWEIRPFTTAGACRCSLSCKIWKWRPRTCFWSTTHRRREIPGQACAYEGGDLFNRGLEIVQIVAEHMADLAPDRPLERQQQRWRQALRAQLELDTDLRPAGTGSNVKTVSMRTPLPRTPPLWWVTV